jgi:uncharacterized protein
MSGPANGREYRRQVLKELIHSLHDGKSVEEVRARFAETFASVSAQEISDAEQTLISEGMPVSEVQRLCDVHASVFKGAIADLHAPNATGTGLTEPGAFAPPADAPGHPVHTFKLENRALEALIEQKLRPLLANLQANGTPDHRPWQQTVAELRNTLEELYQVHIHYLRKENLLFPLLENYGITAPPKVMWGVDDEIRGKLKRAKEALNGPETAVAAVMVEEAVTQLTEMIFKEDNILFPMCLENFKPSEWDMIARESGDIGWCLIDGPDASGTMAGRESATSGSAGATGIPGIEGTIVLPTGILTVDQLVGMLNMLPFDITFVDANDTVRYFSQGTERIFARTKAIIGRAVSNCHPPSSVHVVEQLVADLKSGKKDSEDFWIHMGDKYVLIRYFAVRGEGGAYLGTLEVTQNIAPIQAIEGQKRLMS